MTNEQILKYADEVYETAVEIRRKLHKMPEMGNKEYETTKYIISLLQKWGIEVQTPLETGAVGVISLGKSDTVLLRADIDALPISEETGLGFSSENEGMMHACGHDIHTACLLAAAKVISEHKDELETNVKFIFQPDEEGNGGADRLVKAGIFEEGQNNRVFGIHIRPESEAGKIAIKYKKSYAASDMFKITVNGKSSHGAQPENGANAISAAAHIVTALEGLVPRTISPNDSAVVSVCTFDSGSAVNIIPDKAVLTGIIRTLGAQTRKLMKERFKTAVKSTAEAFGCSAEIEIKESYPGVVNSDEETALIESHAVSLFGRENVEILSEPTMTTEDFGYYLEKAGGCFYHIGAGTNYPLHNSRMSPDESCMKSAIAMHVKSCMKA